MLQWKTFGKPANPAVGNPGEEGYVAAVVGTGLKGMIGISTPTQSVTCWLAGLVVLGPIVVWVADIFWRTVDVTMINLGRKLENACLDNNLDSSERLP